MKRLAVFFVFTLIAGTLVAQEKSLNTYIKEAQEAYRAKDFRGSYSAYQQAIEMGKKQGELDSTLYFNAGLAAYRSRHIEDAIKYFDNCTEYGVQAEKAYLLKYKLKKKTGKKEEAAQTLEEGYKNFPDNQKLAYQYNFSKGSEYYKKGAAIIKETADLQDSEKKKDIKKLNKAVKKANGNFKEALPYLQKAYEAIPRKQVAQILKTAYTQLGMEDKAQEVQAKLE